MILTCANVSVHMCVHACVCGYEILFKEPLTVEKFMASFPLFSFSLRVSYIHFGISA